ncbi:thioesterase [Streptomyces sp. ms191]|uniref:thioesterase II family protein n=1 Tax=unclassified Streptomyces TaxID=2593676 RepID=UPI0011CE3608|nr:alpha/beta fold hydrolase [Streptomyces sp. ms191]TXS21811.1 thioesterase [Streptomyces sp. ms191]
MTPTGHPAPAAPRVFSRRTHARAGLICFPHAGGAAGAYRAWALESPWDVEVSAVQYPGRGDRFGEPVAADMAGLVDDVVAGLLREHTADTLATTVLFGHSMGAAVAYETARRLAVTGRPPAGLVVSGQPAPRRTRGGTLHLADDAGLLADLRRLGGTGQDVLDDGPLLAALLPAVRGDYRLIETYRPLPGCRLTLPVTVLYAGDDPEVTAEEALAWSEVTDGACEVAAFSGGHFYLETRREEVLARVLKAVRAALPVTVSAWPATP